MLRKLSVAVVASTLSGATLAASLFAVQPSPTFPSSVSEAGPNYPAPTSTYAPAYAGGAARGAAPSSVSESMPEMTGGQSHPTMGTGTTRNPRQGGTVSGPSSVSESMPEMSGGQTHPTMRH